MTYSSLDNEELLRLGLQAMNEGRQAESVSLLKTLVDRDGSNAYATYLLAAQHAGMGLMDRAEQGFRRTVELGDAIPTARFQLGQVLLAKGQMEEARLAFAPLFGLPSGLALGWYARAMAAVASENTDEAMQMIDRGLACEQDIPALADDMQRVRQSLSESAGGSGGPSSGDTTLAPAATMLLANYGKSQ